jgi:hypothetical protein
MPRAANFDPEELAEEVFDEDDVRPNDEPTSDC